MRHLPRRTFLKTVSLGASAPRDHFGTKDRELEGAVDQNGPLTELLA